MVSWNYDYSEGTGRLTLSRLFSDGGLYMGVGRPLGRKKWLNLVFQLDAQHGTFAYVDHGTLPQVWETELVVGACGEKSTLPQVVVWSK